MSMLTPEMKSCDFWYKEIREADTQAKQFDLAFKIAGLFALVDIDPEPEVISE